jgi:hypothetical protein
MTEIPLVAAAVMSSLESKWPASVDRESVLVTGEVSDVQIVLIPHRQLGGLCLGVWADSRGVAMLWARVSDLSTHDELDLAPRATRTPWEPDWSALLHEQLRAELERPISVIVSRNLLRYRLYSSPSPPISVAVTAK